MICWQQSSRRICVRHKTPKWHRFASVWVLATKSLSCSKKFLCCDWMEYVNDLMGEMAYIMTFHACVKIDVNYLHVRKWLTSLDMVNFDFVNSIFYGHFMLLETLQNSNGKRHPNMFIIVDFLDVIGRFSEMNPFILSKSGLLRKKLGKIIACTWMEYTFGGNLPKG